VVFIVNLPRMNGVVASTQNINWFHISPFSNYIEITKENLANSPKKSKRKKEEDHLSHAQFIVNVDSKVC
jgi:hypothetical protein